MRFSLLPIGERFEFQDAHYSKNGPLTAVNLDTNQQRMIPRSALVKPQSPSTATAETTAAPATPLDPNTVSNAFDQYHETCLQILVATDEDKTALQEKLKQARQRFLAECGLT